MINNILLIEGDWEDKVAADFGCGTGMISAALLCAGVEYSNTII